MAIQNGGRCLAGVRPVARRFRCGSGSGVRPVDPGLPAGRGPKSQTRVARAKGPELHDAVTEVVGTAGVAARPGHVEQPCGGERGESLQRPGDESLAGVELRRATPAPALALHPCLARHPFDDGVMDAGLGGDGAHPPVLDEVVAQDLRPEFVVDCHRARRSVPGATASASSHRGAAPPVADDLAERARTEVTVHPGSAARCASSLGGRFGRHRRIRLALRNSMTGECTTARGGSGTVMRHLLPAHAFTAPAPVAALTLGVTVPAAARVLIPASRRTQRFTPGEAAATCTAVPLTPITARADEHRAPASDTEKLSGIVHRSPRRGGLDDLPLPGNTGIGAVRKCGSGRSLGRDRQAMWSPRLRRPPRRFRSHSSSRTPSSRVCEAMTPSERQRQFRWGTTTRLRRGRGDDPEQSCSDPAESVHEGCSPDTGAPTCSTGAVS